jgi:spore coat polysaccharide biosynthesis predicted glycosyltransferase SpsG
MDYIQQGCEFANLIINQNFHAQERDYQKICPQGRILAGLKYLVLRKEFLSSPAYRRKRNQGVKKILNFNWWRRSCQ